MGGDEIGDTLVDEVTGVIFEYFDGTSWASAWDGTQPGPDGVTPIGPPRAVRVTLTLQVPGPRAGQATTKQVSQVILIRSAPGPYTPPQLDPLGDPNSTGSSGTGTTGSGTTGTTGAATGGTTGAATGGAATGGGATGGATGGTRSGSTGKGGS